MLFAGQQHAPATHASTALTNSAMQEAGNTYNLTRQDKPPFTTTTIDRHSAYLAVVIAILADEESAGSERKGVHMAILVAQLCLYGDTIPHVG